MALLLDEMRLASVAASPLGALESVYFGGGTPSLLNPEHAERLIRQAEQTFGLATDAEITLEANPGTVDSERLAGFRAAGVNRLSLGVQSFDDDMLATLGRIHTSGQARDAFSAARAAGFTSIGIDLIHSLPCQTLEMWQRELEQAQQLAPEHISAYGLTIEAGTPFAERYDNDAGRLLPDQDLSAEMFELADSVLTAAGYEHYEIANYARPGCRSRHNSGYWQRDGYLGLGAGAHSFLKDQGFGTRFGNEADIEEYAAAVHQGILPRRDVTVLTREDAMAEFMFLGLRMADGVDSGAFEREFGVTLEILHGRVIEELSRSGLLVAENGRLRLTLRGMLLSNRVFMQFLR